MERIHGEDQESVLNPGGREAEEANWRRRLEQGEITQEEFELHMAEYDEAVRAGEEEETEH